MLPETLRHYWTGDLLAANVFIGLNLLGALLLGMLVGYERSYQGRAAVPSPRASARTGFRTGDEFAVVGPNFIRS
jgi:hypothetical protein